MSDGVPIRVSVIIPTQRRPAPLALALGSVLAQTGVDAAIEIVIVDNDNIPSAQAAVQARAAVSAIPIRYVHEPRPGVAHARNAAVVASRGTLIAFLDDDEEAPTTWLADLLAVQARFDADAVFGPVNARLPASITRHRAYLTRFFSRPAPVGAPVEGQRLDRYYGCGNSLVRRAALPSQTEPFDLSRNHIGGEDDLLFGTMQAAGARFAWATQAWVHEDPAPERLTLGYTLRRAFAYGQGPTSHCAAHSDRIGMARWMVIGLGQAATYGVIGAVKWAVRAPDVADTWDRAARGLGKTFWGGPLKIQFYGTQGTGA
jgi:succinoglycan biosynthesis protein ExoM